SALQLLFVGGLIASCFLILRPFLSALSWATAIVVATWPVLLQLQEWLRGRRSLAVALMTLALVLMLVVPLYFAVAAIAGTVDRITEWSKWLTTLPIPQLPAWVESLPWIGPKLTETWSQVVAESPEELSTHLAPYAQTIALWFVAQVGGIGGVLLQFLLT